MTSQDAPKKSKTNFYLTLDLMPGATHNEILHAYNRAKNTYTSGSLASYSLLDDGSTQPILEEIEAAFQVLGNPARRRKYDLEMGYQTWSEEEALAAADAHTGTAGEQSAKPLPFVARTSSLRSTTASSLVGESEGAVLKKTTAAAVKPAPVREIPSGRTEFQPNPEFEKKIAECTEVDGAFLKAVRIYRGYTPESLGQRCKLSPSHILSVENEDTSSQPQTVYLRGHVYLICQALDLPNPPALAKVYIDKLVVDGKMGKRQF